MRLPGSLVFPLLLCLAGCSLDYEEAIVKETMSESIPDVVLNTMRHSLVREGKIVAVLEASRAVQYEKRNQTLLEEVHFQEMDDSGVVLTEIWTDEAVWHTDTEDAEATGDIYVYSFKEEAEVFAQSLSWKKQDRLLAAGAEEEVVLRREDGSELRGKGFVADFRRGDIKMNAARGVYVYEEKASGDGADAQGTDSVDSSVLP